MKKLGNVLWGLVIIAIGIIIGLNSLGIANINIFFSGVFKVSPVEFFSCSFMSLLLLL